MRRFAFLVHPRDRRDIDRHRAQDPERFDRALRELCPVELAQLEYRGAIGSVIAVPLTTRQMVRLPRRFVRHKVLEAAQLAQRAGAAVIGLGAMTSVVTRGGRWLAPWLSSTVTNGSALTAATVVAHAESLGSSTCRRIAILGGSGSVGLCIAQLLQQSHLELVLVGRSAENLRYAVSMLRCGQVRTAQDPAEATNVDLIIVATAGPDPILHMADVGANTPVLDLSEPTNVLVESGYRGDPRLQPSGRVHLDGVDLSACMPELAPGAVYACLAETVLFALKRELSENSVEPPKPEWARKLGALAASVGIHPVIPG